MEEQDHDASAHENAGTAADPARVVGVGPWSGEWPDGSHFDPELLSSGDRRNVADKYRYWSVEAIVADLDRSRAGLQIAIENIEHDLNMGSVVRTANAFNCSRVHIIGRRRWNRRGAMVTDRYLHLEHHHTTEDFVAWARERSLPLIGIDNVPGSKPIERFAFPAEAILVFGQEGPGLSSDLSAELDVILAISQFGSTRSLNVAAAAAIAMYAWRIAQSPPN